MSKTLPLLPALLALSFGASSAFAASSTADELAKARTDLEILGQRLTAEHPKMKAQQITVDDLQLRFDAEARNYRIAGIDARAIQTPIIRTALKIQNVKVEDGSPATRLVASPTLVTQAGQVASITVENLGVALTSSVDEQNNISSALEFVTAASGKNAEEPARVVINSRPGETASAKVGNLSVDLVASLVEPKGISVDFPGGTLAQLIDSLNTAGSRPFNLIAAEDVLGLKLPAFKLRNVEPRDLALAIDWMLDGYIVDVPDDKPGRNGVPVFTVRVNNRSNLPRPVEEQAKPERFKSYSLSALGNRFPVEEVVATINAAWTLDPSHSAEALRLKYHAATGILLVSSREQAALEIVEAVMRSLADEAGRRPAPTP